VKDEINLEFAHIAIRCKECASDDAVFWGAASGAKIVAASFIKKHINCGKSDALKSAAIRAAREGEVVKVDGVLCLDCDGVFQRTSGYERCPCRLYAPHHAGCCRW